MGVGGGTAAAAALRGCGSPGPAAPSFLRLISALSEGSPGGGRLGEEWKSGPPYVRDLETARLRLNHSEWAKREKRKVGEVEERLVSVVGRGASDRFGGESSDPVVGFLQIRPVFIVWNCSTLACQGVLPDRLME